MQSWLLKLQYLCYQCSLKTLHLHLNLQELASHKKQGPGFLSRMGETVRAVAATVRGVKNRPEEFNAIQDYVDNFSVKLTSLDKVTQRIIKEKRGTALRLYYYQPQATHFWSIVGCAI